jgi:hypothetical protein
MILLGAFLAGVFLALKDLIPWAQARASGSIRSRGHNRQVVRRQDDPEQFRLLLRNRLRDAWPGCILMMATFGIWLWTSVVPVFLSGFAAGVGNP